MRSIIIPLKAPAAKGLVAAATFSLLFAFAALPTAHAQTDHSGSLPHQTGVVPLPKGATTDKGTYTSQDTVGSKATRNKGTGIPSGNTRDMQDGKAGGVQDTTYREGNSSGNTSTGTRPRQDTTTPGRRAAPSDTLDGGSKAGYESGSRTQDGSQLNRNKTKPSATGTKQYD
jgi:hypothetical protein